jgi:PAB1-binding protein PBP1
MQNQFVDLYRNGIKSAAEILCASMASAVQLQQQQLDIARNAVEQAGKSAGEISEAKNMDDLLSLQSRLAGAQMERITEFWSNWLRATTDYQKSMIDQMQSQMGQAKDRVRQGYEFTTRTSEEAARVVATQVESATGPLRQAAAQQERKAQQEQQQRKSA